MLSYNFKNILLSSCACFLPCLLKKKLTWCIILYIVISGDFMELKFKIYIAIIVFLTGFLIYAVFFMKSDFIQTKSLPSTIAGKKVTVGDKNITTYKPDFLPKPIPEEVLKGAKENEFYYYMFFNPNKRYITYLYNKKSTSPKDSESFHNQIESYIRSDLVAGSYKNTALNDIGIEAYERRILEFNEAANYVPKEGDSKHHKDKMLDKKAEIDAVKRFIRECTKTMCIINPSTNEYVKISKRDINMAKKTLKDYELW